MPAISELLDSLIFGRLVEHLLIANGLPLAKMQSKFPSHNTFHLLLLLCPTLGGWAGRSMKCASWLLTQQKPLITLAKWVAEWLFAKWNAWFWGASRWVLFSPMNKTKTSDVTGHTYLPNKFPRVTRLEMMERCSCYMYREGKAGGKGEMADTLACNYEIFKIQI